jgi:hypothetical protein
MKSLKTLLLLATILGTLVPSAQAAGLGYGYGSGAQSNGFPGGSFPNPPEFGNGGGCAGCSAPANTGGFQNTGGFPNQNTGSFGNTGGGFTGNSDPTFPQTIASNGKPSRSQVANQIRIHTRKRNLIAGKLNSYWRQERDISGERDRMGRAGEMGSVYALDNQLYQIRESIDVLRMQLTRENQIIAQLEQMY